MKIRLQMEGKAPLIVDWRHLYSLVILLIEIALISIPADQDVWHPFRRAAHNVAEALYRNFRAAFDDQLIVDMADNPAEGQIPHGKAQEIPGDGLDDVLHEFRTVGFYPFPFLRGADSLIGDGFSAETVFSNAGLHIGELPPRRKGDEEHAAFVGEVDASDFGFNSQPDGCLYGVVYVPLELYDVRISLPPGIDQRLQFFFLQAVIQGAHRFQGTDRSAVSEGEFRDLALLPEMAVDTVLLNRYAKHLGC